MEEGPMKCLVLGSAGMAGHMISLYLLERGHDVRGFARREGIVPTILGDVRNTELLTRTLREGNYDATINCVGLLNRFAQMRPAEAVYLNAYLPHLLAQITADMPTRVVQMSTDCVFSGRTGGYTEDALRDGESFYDRSKALGELEDAKNLTLRNSIVGPDMNPNGIGLLNWFMGQTGTIKGYTGSIWTGQTTLQLAKTMEAALSAGAYGLYNAVPHTAISKYELLCLFNRYLRNDALRIDPVEGVRLDKSLCSTRTGLGCDIPDYETMVRELADWMRAHKRLYPHYDL